MKMEKRLLSVLLGLAMVLGLMPATSLTAYADGVTEYDLWVGGTRVTSENKGNVPVDGGTVSFTPADGDTPATLTLDGATITTGDKDQSLIYCDLKSGRNPVPLKIVLLGDNNVKNQNVSYGIRSQGLVTISGPGSLTINVNGAGIASEGSTGAIEINSGTVTAISESGNGIACIGGVTISGGEVTASGLGPGILGLVKNSMAGTGWTDRYGNVGETAIKVSEEGQPGQSLENYKKVHFKDPSTEPVPGPAPTPEPGSGSDSEPTSDAYPWQLAYGWPYYDTYTGRASSSSTPAVERVAMHRLFNPRTGEHFYTASERERDDLKEKGWNYEGIAFYAPKKSNTPVWRLYNPKTGEHHYTTSKDERDKLVKDGWTDEGIGWYADDARGKAMHRLFDPKANPVASHHFTSSDRERQDLVASGWIDEGVGFYALS